ncbi:MAG: hypothetical protein OXI81_02740 [Paracoccaceae bacterium]|nr:hypothetical protein [Paracoccaceae bacterium]MDE2914868.1 hypothetical protein [Paracoccaceae bacterium]
MTLLSVVANLAGGHDHSLGLLIDVGDKHADCPIGNVRAVRT